MVNEKKVLGLEEMEAQTALALPERETPATVVIGCLAVQALNVTLLGLTGTQLSCTVRQ